MEYQFVNVFRICPVVIGGIFAIEITFIAIGPVSFKYIYFFSMRKIRIIIKILAVYPCSDDIFLRNGFIQLAGFILISISRATGS